MGNEQFMRAKILIEGLERAEEYGMRWEFIEWFLRNLGVTEEQVHVAVFEAHREWDL